MGGDIYHMTARLVYLFLSHRDWFSGRSNSVRQQPRKHINVGPCINCAKLRHQISQEVPASGFKAEEVKLWHPLDTRSSCVKMSDCTSAAAKHQNTHVYAPLHIFKATRPLKTEPAHYTLKKNITLLTTASAGFFFFFFITFHVGKHSWRDATTFSCSLFWCSWFC